MKIQISDDFDLQKIDDSGQCFRVKRDKDGSYRFIHLDGVLHIRPEGGQSYEVSCDKKKWHEVWEPYFDLTRNYEKIRALTDDGDAFMKAAASFGAGIRILKQDPFEMLLTFIISQRRNIPSIKRSVELLCDRFGTGIKDGDETVKLFPRPSQMCDLKKEDLSGLSLGYRDEYILDACRRVGSGDLKLYELYDETDENLYNALKSVKGVGDKVAGCIGLFAYERTGMVPVDTWIKRVITEEYGGKDPFARYGQYAGIMQQWAFYYIRYRE
ncbi:MAG: DNA-3-methyladenine glycosylase 2 family protein [Lachnospiraceae bacterium]|nr:DNA-3-methyladenine glycosylase 2 family protein [Lachnospiraceae bacterium]